MCAALVPLEWKKCRSSSGIVTACPITWVQAALTQRGNLIKLVSVNKGGRGMAPFLFRN